ncbi:unnamed protein product [Candida verbasci]|uniref:Myosin motor domain-containing protein n=1 Tax=Candida verbasci TaxID=1227364 RepID=A0A9W4XIG0_9ASCO|nr:unnamed protein product [Candida verbasci]
MSDIKNWVWVPNDTDIFVKGYVLEYLDNNKVKVKINHQEKIIDQNLLQPCNPTQFDKCNDMAELTHLNEASVIHNLLLRYQDDLIYTYSGLFLVAINPYKSLPIYNSAKDYYKNNNNPPHIYSIAENTFKNLLSNRKDQSILVTGESGAGKTENTKKIIQYYSSIKENENNIDVKILQANPILESFGNAKTIKNNNSSRFGKFIKIFFDETGDITGANIDYYLLEKSRVVSQAKNERNYHIFYQFLKGYENLSDLGLNKDLSTYKYLNNVSINVDDFKEFNLLVEGFKIMEFSKDEINFIYQILAVVLHFGNLDFISWKSEQANFAKNSPVDKIADLLGIDKSKLVENLIKPKVKAGREFVTKSKKPNEVKFTIDAFAKYLYEKLFQFIINKINQSLNGQEGNSIGVLDIAGFEIFDINSFEQLCINYTNEKLQQFFNHRSFILEQSEYLKENIQWEFIDFGQDLQPTIDLIETRQPMGILKLLDEECLMPKSSDKSFMERLSSSFKKNHKFSENKFKSGFVIHHYAGNVEYNVENWLQKNTDPVSENMLSLLTESKNPFIAALFEEPPKSKVKTASQKHKDQLKELMNQLESTEPHFVRCILPNLEKKANKFDKNLVLNQLRCNGVLEGIRITRAGYPNRMMFDEFLTRYSIISDEVFTKNSKSNCEIILKCLDPETYRVGLTKIFFKNGILGQLEATRDLKLKGIFTDIQRVIRGNLIRKNVRQEIKKIQSATLIAKSMKKINEASPWMELFFHIKPLLEDSVKDLDSKEIQNLTIKLKDSENLQKGLEKDNEKLRSQLNKLENEIISTTSMIKEKESIVARLKGDENKSNKKFTNLEIKFKDLLVLNDELKDQQKKLTSRSLELHDKNEAKAMELTSLNEKLADVTNELESHKSKLADVTNQLNSHKSKLSDVTKELNSHKTQSKELSQSEASFKEKLALHESSKAKYEAKIDEAKEKITALKQKVEKKTAELSQSKKEIIDLKAEISSLKGEIASFKSEISTLQNKLKETEEAASSKQEIESAQLQILQKEQLTKAQEYKQRISQLNSQISNLQEELSNKENYDPQFIEEFTHMKFKLNENGAALRKEKFENKKLVEELRILKERIMNGSLTSSDLTPKRRSLAIGERNIIGTVDNLNKEINELKLQLQQEQGNFQRAENYAIELQKKLNAIQSTRGLNSNDDYEKKFKEAQTRINKLESKIESLITDGPTPETLSRSESFGMLPLRGVSQDFVQIYQDITKTLKLTREELGTSKSEILRLKSLLRESEEELYQVKQHNFKTSVNDYEQDLAQIKVKYDNLLTKNDDLSTNLEVFKKRSEEYFKKLELAESAVTISKRHEENAIKEMKEYKSQLLLIKEELRTSQILIKDFRQKTGKLEEQTQEKNHEIERVKQELQETKDKLDYHVKNYENKEANEQLKEEIRNLHKDLNFKTEKETVLIKENKKLELDLEETILIKNNFEKQLEEAVLKEEELENTILEFTDKTRTLENEKIINERRINNFNKQVSGLKELVDDISTQRDKLLSEKEELDDKLFKLNLNYDNKSTELDQTKSELTFLKKHLENQKQDSEAIQKELNQSKLSSTSDYRDQQKLRSELLVTNQENFSLKKTNKELNKKVTNLEEKLYSNEQLNYWEDKCKSLNNNIDTLNNEKYEQEKTIKTLQRTLKSLEIRVENESQLSKKYNDENFDYQNKINHYKSTIDILHNENVDKELQLKSFERENNEMKESMLLLQKELLELRQNIH